MVYQACALLCRTESSHSQQTSRLLADLLPANQMMLSSALFPGVVFSSKQIQGRKRLVPRAQYSVMTGYCVHTLPGTCAKTDLSQGTCPMCCPTQLACMLWRGFQALAHRAGSPQSSSLCSCYSHPATQGHDKYMYKCDCADLPLVKGLRATHPANWQLAGVTLSTVAQRCLGADQQHSRALTTQKGMPATCVRRDKHDATPAPAEDPGTLHNSSPID